MIWRKKIWALRVSTESHTCKVKQWQALHRWAYLIKWHYNKIIVNYLQIVYASWVFRSHKSHVFWINTHMYMISKAKSNKRKNRKKKCNTHYVHIFGMHTKCDWFSRWESSFSFPKTQCLSIYTSIYLYRRRLHNKIALKYKYIISRHWHCKTKLGIRSNSQRIWHFSICYKMPTINQKVWQKE